MAIRIIFRGLVLFRIENERGKNGRIVAQLVDCKHMMGGGKKPKSPHKDLHTHTPEIQIGPEGMVGDGSADDEAMAGMKSAAAASAANVLPPTAIHGDIQIGDPSSGAPVKVADSYREHCPNLSHILNNRPRHTLPKAMKKPSLKRNKFVSRTVTIYGGTIRVNEVVAWDGAAYPLASSPNNGSRFTSPAEVSFLTSTVRGHMASECVVEVDSVDISKGQKGLPKHIDDGEILITNLPPERPKPVPWSLHFFCLFQAAGYAPADIDGNELDWFKEFGRAYDPVTFPEDEAFLGKDGHTGFPFPYLDPETALTPLNPITPPLTDPWNRPLCPQGDNSPHH